MAGRPNTMTPVGTTAKPEGKRGFGRTAACVLIALGTVCSVQAAELPGRLGEKLLHNYIAPAMRDFQLTADGLRGNLESWCAAPTAQGRQAVAAGYAKLLQAWSGIEFLRFGPLVAANRYERINFWPDPRGIALRQVQGLLAQSGPVPDARALARNSVAVQGLPALEYVLYREGGLLEKAGTADAETARSCSYAVSVAGNLAAVGAELRLAWEEPGDYARQFAMPSPSNPLYRNEQEVAAEAMKALSTGLQFARDVKLLPMLGKDMAALNYKRAPFWRSDLSHLHMAAAVDGMLRFYQAGGYRYDDAESWMDGNFRQELERVQENFSSMPRGIQEYAPTADGYRRYRLAALLLKNAKSILDEHIAPGLGVRIGFNALDGD